MNRAGIRVSINGAAGDETLAGYHEYYGLHLRSLCRLGHWTRFGKELFSSSEDSSSRLWSRILGAIRALPLRRSDESLRVRMGPSSPFNMPARLFTSSGPSLEICQRLLDDMGSWRMNYWMRSGNKSAMGVPIEVRFPFLDFQVLGFAFTLPISYLIRGGWMKWVLRESVKDLVPVDVVWRRNKMGFPFPYVEWLTSSRQLFLSMIDRLDCPYLDMKKLHASYSGLVQQDPLFLWRMISVALWWKRCVQGDTLS